MLRGRLRNNANWYRDEALARRRITSRNETWYDVTDDKGI